MSDYEFELLVRSITEDGFTQPIVCQASTREFVDGEHRWTAAIVSHHLSRNGIEINEANCRDARARRLEIIDPELEIPVAFVQMSIEQMKIATLRHNKARGSHDIELEAAVLRDLQQLGALGWAQESLMLDDIELQRMLEDVNAAESLANEEFTEAWEPDKIGQDDLAQGSTKAREIQGTTHGGTMVTAMTPKAIEQMREREKNIQAAKTEEEKVMAKKASNLYRLNLMFQGEEGDIVRRVLGDEPAVKLLELCRAADSQ